MPLISLANSLNGGDEVVAPSARALISSSPGVWLTGGALLLNQMLLFALVFKRREFGGESGNPNQHRPIVNQV